MVLIGAGVGIGFGSVLGRCYSQGPKVLRRPEHAQEGVDLLPSVVLGKASTHRKLLFLPMIVGPTWLGAALPLGDSGRKL